MSKKPKKNTRKASKKKPSCKAKTSCATKENHTLDDIKKHVCQSRKEKTDKAAERRCRLTNASYDMRTCRLPRPEIRQQFDVHEYTVDRWIEVKKNVLSLETRQRFVALAGAFIIESLRASHSDPQKASDLYRTAFLDMVREIAPLIQKEKASVTSGMLLGRDRPDLWAEILETSLRSEYIAYNSKPSAELQAWHTRNLKWWVDEPWKQLHLDPSGQTDPRLAHPGSYTVGHRYQVPIHGPYPATDVQPPPTMAALIFGTDKFEIVDHSVPALNDYQIPDVSRERYGVEWVALTSLQPSPENDVLYGKATSDDETMDDLRRSIREEGLGEPLLVSLDHYIISGHRRFFAMKCEGTKIAPVFRLQRRRSENLACWPSLLMAHNPQRIKSVTATMMEETVRTSHHPRFGDSPPLTARPAPTDMALVVSDRVGGVGPPSSRSRDLVDAMENIVLDLSEYWPLSARQVHYALLNKKPLKDTSKPDSAYQNDDASYKRMLRVLKQARVHGVIDDMAFDDRTRKITSNSFWRSSHEFVLENQDEFMSGYRLNRQVGQPIHIQAVLEKNTVCGVCAPVCDELCVPMIPTRGYVSRPILIEMVKIFRQSGCEQLLVVSLSDHDPEGFDLMDNLLAQLRDEIACNNVNMIRAGVTMKQIRELKLYHSGEPAKSSSARYNRYVADHNIDRVWECEAIPPRYLANVLRQSICSAMDMKVFDAAIEREKRDLAELQKLRKQIFSSLDHISV